MKKRALSRSPPTSRKRHVIEISSGCSSPTHLGTSSPESETESAQAHSDTLSSRTLTSISPARNSSPSSTRGLIGSIVTPLDALMFPGKSTQTGTMDHTSALVPYSHQDAFPLFSKGDVVITSKLDATSNKSWQLHSLILANHSSMFATSIREVHSVCPALKWFSYTIEEVDGVIKLVRQHAHGECPIIHSVDHGTDVHIKSEDDVPQSSSYANTAAIECYSQVFGTFYNISPHISNTKVDEALKQAEGLTKVAAELGCLPLLRPYLSSTFGQFRQQLFIAIKDDPPRWIMLAIALEDTSIYTECLIHLVGAYPNTLWPTRRKILPPELVEVLQKKSEVLDQLCLEVDRDLLMSHIVIGTHGNGKAVTCEPGTTETWIVVQLFRDTIFHALNDLDKMGRSKKAISRGRIYRKINSGGDAYMDFEYVKSHCSRMVRGNFKELGDDLRGIKDYASNLTKDIAQNELMIDPDAHELEYLTCVKVADDDIPWKRVL